MEKWFFDYGVIQPGYHTFYLMGINVTSANNWPKFTHVDATPAPNATNSSYTNWGGYISDVTSEAEPVPEPNNLFPPEHCAGANYTESSGLPWMWSDTNCNAAWPFMCKSLRGWLCSTCTQSAVAV